MSVLENTKAAVIVSAGTTGSGLGTILDLIPDGIGKLATLIGIALSIVLIRVHLANLRKIKAEAEVYRLKADALRREAEAVQEVSDRKS